MSNISIDDMSEDQAKTLLNEIADIFGIGEKVPAHCLKTNISNCRRFADLLHTIEHEFFMVAGEPDEDYPDDEPEQECLVNSWGSSKEKYVEQFRAALKTIQ